MEKEETNKLVGFLGVVNREECGRSVQPLQAQQVIQVMELDEVQTNVAPSVDTH